MTPSGHSPQQGVLECLLFAQEDQDASLVHGLDGERLTLNGCSHEPPPPRADHVGEKLHEVLAHPCSIDTATPTDSTCLIRREYLPSNDLLYRCDVSLLEEHTATALFPEAIAREASNKHLLVQVSHGATKVPTTILESNVVVEGGITSNIKIESKSSGPIKYSCRPLTLSLHA